MINTRFRMSTNKTKLPNYRIHWIKEQGYFHKTDAEVEALAFGNRFAFRLCTTFLLIGWITANVWILGGMMLVAFLGIVLPHHPFDYIYNHLLSERMGKPKLPRRSNQLKFACSLATILIGVIIGLFASGMTTAGYVFGGTIMIIPILVSTIDLCIPSKIYNALFLSKEGASI